MTQTLAVRLSPVELLMARDGDAVGIRIRCDHRYVRVRRGVYAGREAWNALAPWDRYLARVHAFAMTHPRTVFCGESAAALLGLPVFGEPRDLHVYDPDRSANMRYGEVMVHASVDPRAIVETGPFAMTSAAHTVVDIARVLPPAFGLSVVDAALRRPDVDDLATLTDIADAQASIRGRRRLEWIWSRADARAESVLETVGRAVIEWWGFEPPELQVKFRTGIHLDRSDFWWRSRRTIGEADGDRKYSDDPAEARRQVLAEKDRENRLRRVSDGFARWGWAETMTTRTTPAVTSLRDVLLVAGLAQVRHPQHAMLATLRSDPRSLRHVSRSAASDRRS